MIPRSNDDGEGGDLYGGWSPLLPLVSQRIRGNRYPGSDTHHLYQLAWERILLYIIYMKCNMFSFVIIVILAQTHITPTSTTLEIISYDIYQFGKWYCVTQSKDWFELDKSVIFPAWFLPQPRFFAKMKYPNIQYRGKKENPLSISCITKFCSEFSSCL